MKRSLAALAALAALQGVQPTASAGEVTVTIDRPGRYTLPAGVQRVFVANPGVADVEVIAADQMMVFGRMPGEADIVLYGANAQRLDTIRVRVGNERQGVVTLYNGAQRFSFRCVDRCEQVPMLGDGGLMPMQQVIANAQIRAAMGQAGGGLDETIVDVAAPPQAEPVRAAPAAADPAS